MIITGYYLHSLRADDLTLIKGKIILNWIFFASFVELAPWSSSREWPLYKHQVTSAHVYEEERKIRGMNDFSSRQLQNFPNGILLL